MDNKYHHLLARELKDVKKILHNQEDEIEITSQETYPPNSKITEGQKRVINIKKIDSRQISIIWCFENYS